MPPNDRKPFGAMFDVKPVDEAGNLDFERIGAVRYIINLAVFKPKRFVVKKHEVGSNPDDKVSGPRQSSQGVLGHPLREPERRGKQESISEKQVEPEKDEEEEYTPLITPLEETLPPVIELPTQENIREQFEELLNHDIDMGLELAKIDTRPVRRFLAKPRYKIIQLRRPRDEGSIGDPHAKLLSEIHKSSVAIAHEEYVDPNVVTDLIPAGLSLELSPEADSNVRKFFTAPVVRPAIRRQFPPPIKKRSFNVPPVRRPPRKFLLVLVSIVIVIGILARYGFHLKRQITEQSSAAVTNLQTAHDDLKAMDFKNASQDFFSAYSNFSKAGNSLNVFGASITNIISDLPGAGTLKSAKNLVQVGQLLSAAGTSMTTALNAVSKTGALSDPSNPNVPIGPIVTALKKALLASKQQVTQANALMADIDGTIIPADKQAGFKDLKTMLPELEAGVNMGADYAKFFENLVGGGKAKYLVMFQNGSELRPTGGFPGTYGVVSFANGKLENIFVDDVYNLDGQLKENIVPPLQMQHITPTWGMRDSNWYVDFSASARNIEKFYKKESGQGVDGVIVINPEMIKKVLEIVGPIEMPQYNLTLNSENVLTTIQSQVEYGTNRVQPKQIVKDFTPLLMSKIYSAGSDKWLAIFNTLVLSMNQRDILMSFDNLSLESFATDKGFGGQVHQGDKDYLMAVITNIKGSKTDAVTDTSMSVDTKFENDSAVHTVTLTRRHNGGAEKFGFYNKQNPAYVRVLVPDGAELISIKGNDKPKFNPLINYAKEKGFVRDDNLTAFETSGTTDTANGVITYHESGKTEFGFWLITDAGKSKTVTVQYRVPKALNGKEYSLYIQKQPALKIKDFKFSLQESADLTPDASSPLLTFQSGDAGGAYAYSGPLDNDLTVKVNFK